MKMYSNTAPTAFVSSSSSSSSLFVGKHRKTNNLPQLDMTLLSHHNYDNAIHSSSSSCLSWGTTLSLSEASSTSSTSFEAVPPDTTILIGMGTVFVLCIIAAFVWNNSVVPVSRTKLALSKSRGEVKEYLEELQQGATTTVENIDNATTITSLATDVPVAVVEGEQSPQSQQEEEMEPQNTSRNSSNSSSTDGRDFERWLFTDWLEQKERKGGRQKEPALPILKDAKWNSGDNPVVVTSGIMLVGVLVASVTERVIP